MTSTDFKQEGFCLISIRKAITILLWTENEDDLLEYCGGGRQIVPCYVKAGSEYIKVADKYIKIGR